MANIPPEGSFDDFSTPPRVTAAGKRRGRGKVRGGKTPKTPKDKVVGPRALSVQRLFAILCALIALIAVFAIVSAKKPTFYVVETSQAVTSLQAMTKTDLIAVAVPKATVVPTGSFTASTAKAAMKEATKAVGNLDPIVSLPQGTILTTSFFSSLSHLESSMGLPVTNRLVSVSANVAGAVGGSLSVGSTVEVVWEPTQGTPTVLAANAVVVSIKGSLSSFESQGSGGLGSTATTVATPVPGIYILSTSAANVLAVGGAEASSNDNDGAVVLIYTGSTASKG